MVSTTDILAAYDSQLRGLVPPAVPAGHGYLLPGSPIRVTGQRRGFIESARDLPADPQARLGFRAITTTTPLVWTPPGRGTHAT